MIKLHCNSMMFKVIKSWISYRKLYEKNVKVCDNLEVKEDLFYEEELETEVKWLKNNKALVAESVAN